MEPGIVNYVFDGDTFVGHSELNGGDEASTLTVWYKGVPACAQLNGLEPERVGKILLGNWCGTIWQAGRG